MKKKIDIKLLKVKKKQLVLIFYLRKHENTSKALSLKTKERQSYFLVCFNLAKSHIFLKTRIIVIIL